MALKVCAALTFCLCAHAGSVSEPTVDIFIDSGSVAAPDSLVPPEPGQILWQYSASASTADYSFQADATIDPDPFLTYGFSVMNFKDTPLLVSKHYSIPVTGGPWNTVLASLSISAVGGLRGFYINSGGSPVQQAAVDSHSLQVGLGADCSSSRSGAVACYSQSISKTFPAVSYSKLDVFVQFILTGKGAGATVSGRVELLDLAPDVSSAPEPGGLALLGLAALLVARRRAPR